MRTGWFAAAALTLAPASAFAQIAAGWHPPRDNPLFSPLRHGDPDAQSGPLCTVSDHSGRELMAYGEEDGDVGLRIGGRLVRFRQMNRNDSGIDNFTAPEGRLRIVQGRVISREQEGISYRATMTFTDRHNRAHVAQVRVDCGV